MKPIFLSNVDENAVLFGNPIEYKPMQEQTWRDIEVEKWEKKAKNCQCRPEKNTIQDRCRLINDDCAYGVCPFVYWGCL